MKNVLLICDSFTSANFHVMLSVIRSLGEVHIHAISAYNESKMDLPQYVDVTYYHVYYWRRSFTNLLKKIPNDFLSKSCLFAFSRITSLYDALFTSTYERSIYRLSLKIIDAENIDAVFSVCVRFYTHRIATKLHKKTGVKWYQFWVDPYSNRKEGGKLWKKCAECLERRFLEDADRIYALPEVFVGSKLIDDYKAKLVTFEIPYLEERISEQKNKDVIFAGGFLKRVREPAPVLNLLLSILDSIDKEIKFHFYVKYKERYEDYTEQSGGRILFHDYVNHQELYRLLSESFMLLNIGNAGSIQMPSKTVEYVSFRKPLLFFYKDPKDASLRYLVDYPDICRINVEDDLNVNKQALISFFHRGHPAISYTDLMQVKAYRESTPSYIKQMLDDQ